MSAREASEERMRSRAQVDKPQWVCGVDEAGRGCLAGPIFAAAVVLDPRTPIAGLADSKQLTPKARLELEREIRASAIGYGIALATVREIDARGIEWANRIVFTRAVRAMLKRFPHLKDVKLVVRIDGTRRAWRMGLPQETIVRGDRTDPAIAAASILAKTARDRYVVETMHPRYPQYGFDRHKGYATAHHFQALEAWGPSPFHRMSFRLSGREAKKAR